MAFSSGSPFPISDLWLCGEQFYLGSEEDVMWRRLTAHTTCKAHVQHPKRHWEVKAPASAHASGTGTELPVSWTQKHVSMPSSCLLPTVLQGRKACCPIWQMEKVRFGKHKGATEASSSSQAGLQLKCILALCTCHYANTEPWLQSIQVVFRQ